MATDPDAYFRLLEQQAQADLERRIAAERAHAEHVARQLEPIAGEVEGIAQRGAEATTAYAKGFSDTMAQLANQSTAGANEYLQQMGMPAGIPEVGRSAADAMYGEFGYIPAVGLRNYGTAQAAAAAMLPATIRMQAEQGLAGLRQQHEAVLRDLRDKRTQYNLFEKPKLEAEKRENARREAMQLYEAGLLTQREFARRMGVRNWRKFPNRPPGQGQQKVNTSLSKELGYLVDDYGNPIRDRKGKPVYLPQEPHDPDIRQQGGYIWERGPDGQWRPVAGTGPTPPKPDKPPNFQTRTVGGKMYVFDPASGTFYDPATGRPTVPRAGTSVKPPSATTMRDARRLIAQARQGWWALAGTPDVALTKTELRKLVTAKGLHVDDLPSLPPKGRALLGIEFVKPPPGDIYAQLIEMGIPAPRAKRMVQRYWKDWGYAPVPAYEPGSREPGARDYPGKGKPAKGGRQNVSYEGPASLAPSLHNAFGYALSQGFTNLGTHNPASRLPGGGISDHAVWPARAFDLGGFSGGWGNAKARKMFWWLTKQPGIEYVILGNRIWSRRNGLRPYTHGGHETHIHVSGTGDAV